MSALSVLQEAHDLDTTVKQQNTSAVAMQAPSGREQAASFLDLVRNAPPRKGSIYMGSQELMRDKVETYQHILDKSQKMFNRRGARDEQEIFELFAAKWNLHQLQMMMNELVLRAKAHRTISLYDHKSIKIINEKPEIRFRVARKSIRNNFRKQIKMKMQEQKEEAASAGQKKTAGQQRLAVSPNRDDLER